MVNVNPECMIGNHKRDGFLPVIFPKHRIVWNWTVPILPWCKARTKVRLVCPLVQKWLWHHNRHEWKKCLHHLILAQYRFHLLAWWEILQFGHGFFSSHRIWLIPYLYDSYTMNHFAYSLHRTDRNHWKAITDLSTGEIMYLIDDNGGSEIYYARKATQVPKV